MGPDPKADDSHPAIDEMLPEILLEAGLIPPEAGPRIREIHEETSRSFTDIVLAEQLVLESSLLAFFARRHRTRFVSAKKLGEASFDPSVAELLPVRAAEAYACLPLLWIPATRSLTLMAAVPLDPDRIEAVRKLTGALETTTCVGTWTAVRAGIQRLYYGNRGAFEELDELGAAPAPRRAPTKEELSENTRVQYRSEKEMLVALRQENARFRIAQSFHRRVPLERTMERQLEAILDLLLDLIPADTAIIQLSSGIQVRRSPANLPDQPLPGALVSKAMESEEGIVLTDPELQFIRTESVVLRGVRSALVMPMRSREEAVGIIYIESVSAPAAFDNDDRALLAALANQAAAAVHNAELLGKVEREAAARTHLSRFLSPDLIDSALAGALDKHLQTRLAVVTVMFVDIRGFTTMCTQASAEDVLGFLGGFYDEMSQAVFAEGGMIDKFMGDGLMAIWGAPMPHPDHARRAVRAALAMNRRGEACEFTGRALEIGIGIATGEVILGTLGTGQRVDYTAVGSTVNLAARLCDGAAPGEVVASEAAFQAAGPMVAEPKGPVSIKGLDTPTTIYSIRALEDAEPVLELEEDVSFDIDIG